MSRIQWSTREESSCKEETRETLTSRDRSLPLIADMQTRLVPVISGIAQILKRNEALLFACRKLDVPVVFTEQYPNGVGHTVPRLLGRASDASG